MDDLTPGEVGVSARIGGAGVRLLLRGLYEDCAVILYVLPNGHGADLSDLAG